MVGGGGGGGGEMGGDGGRVDRRDSPPATYDFVKRAKRFEPWFVADADKNAEIEGAKGTKVTPITLLPDKVCF